MKTNRGLFVLAGLLMLAPSLALGLLQVGQEAPNFTLPDTAGQSHSLNEYRGRVVLLNFWTST